MKSARAINNPSARSRRARGGFTLAEVLAALLFLAIVLPAAVEVLHVASLAGEVAARKSEAVRVADRELAESLVTTNWLGSRSGVVTEGVLDFHWTLNRRDWTQLPAAPVAAPMELLTVNVTYSAQGRDYSVNLSTLAPPVISTLGQAAP